MSTVLRGFAASRDEEGVSPRCHGRKDDHSDDETPTTKYQTEQRQNRCRTAPEHSQTRHGKRIEPKNKKEKRRPQPKPMKGGGGVTAHTRQTGLRLKSPVRSGSRARPELVGVGLRPPRVEGADADACAAVGAVFAPELVALLAVDRPFQGAGAAALTDPVVARLVLEAYGLDLAGLGALLAGPAELVYAELDGLVRLKREVGIHLAEAYPWPVLGGDEQPVPA